MDVQMPEMDGFEATRRIRARPGAGPRIVAVTANALAGDEQRCREAGMDAYISKPIDLRELAAALADTPVIAAADAPATPVAAPAPVPADHRAEMRATLEETFGAEGARELVETLVSDLRVQSAELMAAQQAGDGPSIARVIHTLKSTSGLMAAHELAQGFAAVEQRCRRGQALAAGADIAALLQRYRDLVDTLEAEFTMESRT
jgi:CheY-like chemotaxis protein